MRPLDYSIGELAALSGVKIPTIRYYDRSGSSRRRRTGGNQRRYDAAARDRLRFIAHARAMGFPMAELKAMLRIANHRDAPCDDIDALVRTPRRVETRIARLTALREELSSMLVSHRHGTVADCRVLEVLADHQQCAHEH